MAVLTDAGRTALAIALTAQPLFLAWGTGDPAWDTTPVPEPTSATALVAELGRRAATTWQFVTPSPTGEIVVPTGQFTASATPTNYVYLTFAFDYADAASAIVREVGIFSGTVVAAGLPAGQVYFPPANVTNPGLLYSLQRFAAITRSANTRQSFEFVLEF